MSIIDINEIEQVIVGKVGRSQQDPMRGLVAGRRGRCDRWHLQCHACGSSSGVVAAFGVTLGSVTMKVVPTPNIDALLGLARLFGRVHGLYPDAP